MGYENLKINNFFTFSPVHHSKQASFFSQVNSCLPLLECIRWAWTQRSVRGLQTFWKGECTWESTQIRTKDILEGVHPQLTKPSFEGYSWAIFEVLNVFKLLCKLPIIRIRCFWQPLQNVSFVVYYTEMTKPPASHTWIGNVFPLYVNSHIMVISNASGERS